MSIALHKERLTTYLLDGALLTVCSDAEGERTALPKKPTRPDA